MAKINFAISQQGKNRGVIIGSGWSNSKNGVGINLRGKIRDSGNKLVDVLETNLIFKTGKEEYVVKLGNWNKNGKWQKEQAKLLVVPNRRKRENSKDPDFTVLGFPEK